MARLTELLQACPPVIERRFHDDLGRLNARVSVCGEDLGTKLIDEGLASLRGVAINWCKTGSEITLIDGDSFIDNDGDTIRVENIDTPSIRSPRCDAEKAMADRTVARVAELFQACPPTIEGSSRDKFGRLNARVLVCGEDLGNKLIGEGLAIQRGSRPTWCKSDSITIVDGDSFIDNKDGDTIRVENIDTPSITRPEVRRREGTRRQDGGPRRGTLPGVSAGDRGQRARRGRASECARPGLRRGPRQQADRRRPRHASAAPNRTGAAERR